MKKVGVFEVKDKDLGGRLGRLYTPHGVLETPALLPVIDPAKQDVSVKEIAEIGFNAVITNAYLLWRRWGDAVADQGVHRFLGFDGIIMTDSGAYQLMRYGRVEITPEQVIEYQQAIGSDIAVILDVPTGAVDNEEQARYSVEETLRRAKEAIKLIEGDKRLWVLPIQGGPFLNLVEKAAKEATKLSTYYQVFAVGSPTTLLERYSYETIIDMVAVARLNTPLSKPLHLFGAGHPMIIPFVVALGVDMFDSASYILYARDSRYITPWGTYRLGDLDYFPCSCPICSKHTPQELLEMPMPERTRLLALHNLYVLKAEINRVKVAIKEGRLWELIVEKAHTHPSLKRALQKLVKYIEYLEKLDPRVKGGEVHGLFMYGIPEELKRPEILRHKRLLETRYNPCRQTKYQILVLAPINPDDKPLISSQSYRVIRAEHGEDTHVVGYFPVLGLIPEELAETYPLSQFEAVNEYPEEVLDDLVALIERFVLRHVGTCYGKIIIYYDEKLPWSKRVAKKLYSRLYQKLGEHVKLKNLQ